MLIRTKALKLFFFILFFLQANKLILAQNTFSPYSLFGIGEIQSGEYGRNAGMAGVSIGFRSTNFLNITNPAAISAIDSYTFVYDFAGSFKFSNFQSLGQSQSVSLANLGKLAMGFQASRNWAISFGLVPYSSVGYKIKSSQFIEGAYNVTEDAHYDGNGGINKLFFINSFRIFPKLYLGINSSYMFGSINKNMSVDNLITETKSTTRSIYFDFGLQYVNKFSENVDCVFGLIYGYRTPLIMQNSIIASFGTDTFPNNFENSQTQYLPAFYGAGLTLTFNKKVTIAADYQFQQFSDINTNYSNVHFSDVHQVKIGFEYLPALRYLKNYFYGIHYQAGFVLSNSYLNINGSQPVNYGLCMGLGLPLKRNAMINLAVEYGKTGSLNYLQIEENYTKLTLSISLTEAWFLKHKYD